MEKDDIASIFCLIYCAFQQECTPRTMISLLQAKSIAPGSQKQCSQKTKALPYESDSITPKG